MYAKRTPLGPFTGSAGAAPVAALDRDDSE